MAKEYTGILLCMLIVLRSKKGKSLVRRMRKFFGEDRLDDWILLIETLLEWEEWMKSPKINEEACPCCTTKTPLCHVFDQKKWPTKQPEWG